MTVSQAASLADCYRIDVVKGNAPRAGRAAPLLARLAAPFAVLVLLACGGTHTNTIVPTSGPQTSLARTWHDPSPHRAGFITVAPGVRLEYLDWGGSGPPMLFLSGLGDSGHEFDDFAPKWIDHFHVLALTRRGFGASSQPTGGYDIGSLVDDVRIVLDSLHLTRVILVGHSLAGDEMTKFAATHPDRVLKLIYLDAAHDRATLGAMFDSAPPPPEPPITAADSASPLALQDWTVRDYGVRWPIGAVRAVYVFGPDGHLLRDVTPGWIIAAVLKGLEHPAYREIQSPALAIYATVDSAPQLFPNWAALDSTDRSKAMRFYTLFKPWISAQPERFRTEVAHGRVVALHGARHYVFISNEAEVIRAMRAFLLEP